MQRTTQHSFGAGWIVSWDQNQLPLQERFKKPCGCPQPWRNIWLHVRFESPKMDDLFARWPLQASRVQTHRQALQLVLSIAPFVFSEGQVEVFVRRIYNSAHVCQYGVHGHCMKDDTHKPRQCKHLETSSIFMWNHMNVSAQNSCVTVCRPWFKTIVSEHCRSFRRFETFAWTESAMCSGGDRKGFGRVDVAVETCQSKEECKTFRSVFLCSICSAWPLHKDDTLHKSRSVNSWEFTTTITIGHVKSHGY